MSDTSQGSGWWQASDGKWYPPESRAGAAAPPPPQYAAAPPPAKKGRGCLIGGLAGIGGLVLLGVIAIIVIIALLTSITPREWLVAGACAGVGILLWLISRLHELFTRGSLAPRVGR